MQIVLRSDVGGVGKKGDILVVADGYARNYLIPRGMAMKATAGVTAQAQAMRRSRDLKDARDRESAEAVARKLVPMVIRLPVRSGPGGRLFGSVTLADVAAAVAAQSGVELDRRRLRVDEPIKTVGSHEVAVKLHADVEFRLNVEVLAAGA
ncbi:MAG: 50S ribosomal protein L9 [Acidimicrobiales bacterium]